MVQKIPGFIKDVKQLRGETVTYYIGTIKPLRGKGLYSFKVSKTAGFNRRPYVNQQVKFEVGATGKNAINVVPSDL